ncbi:MAG: sialidase family protein [Mycobacteriales bacterium]
MTYQAGGSTPARPASAPWVCSTPTGYPAGEPTIGITRTGTVAFYPAYPSVYFTRVGLAVSTDGGASFHFTPITGIAGQQTHQADLDPYMYLDPVTSRIFVASNTTGNCDVVSWSDDGGASWATPSVAGCVSGDHENLFSGRAPAAGAAPVGYPDIVYYCSYSAGLLADLHFADSCEKSLDGGQTWTPTGKPAFVWDPTQFTPTDLKAEPTGCMQGLGHGVVGPDGTIYLPAGMCGVPEVAISHDEGQTWTTSVVSRTVLLHGFPDGGTVDDTAVAVDREGHLYAVWVAHNQLPYLAVSADGGRTWSTPVEIAPPGVVATDLAEVAVGAPGRLAVDYMGSTNAAPFPSYGPCPGDPNSCLKQTEWDLNYDQGTGYANVTWSGYIGETTDALSAHPEFTTGTVSPGPLVRGTCAPEGCAVEKDFLDVRIAPDGTVWGSFVDGCSSTCASTPGGSDDINVGLAAHLAGGPDLWR